MTIAKMPTRIANSLVVQTELASGTDGIVVTATVTVALAAVAAVTTSFREHSRVHYE